MGRQCLGLGSWSTPKTASRPPGRPRESRRRCQASAQIRSTRGCRRQPAPDYLQRPRRARGQSRRNGSRCLAVSVEIASSFPPQDGYHEIIDTQHLRAIGWRFVANRIRQARLPLRGLARRWGAACPRPSRQSLRFAGLASADWSGWPAASAPRAPASGRSDERAREGMAVAPGKQNGSSNVWTDVTAGLRHRIGPERLPLQLLAACSAASIARPREVGADQGEGDVIELRPTTAFASTPCVEYHLRTSYNI